MRRRAFVAAGGVIGLSGCLDAIGGGGVAGQDYDVGMTARAFEPVEFTVAVGDTVVWRNTSSRAHTVTAIEDAIPEESSYFASGGYDSQSEAEDAWFTEFGGRLNLNDIYEHTFEVPGVHEYYCIPHVAVGMFGTIVVDE